MLSQNEPFWKLHRLYISHHYRRHVFWFHPQNEIRKHAFYNDVEYKVCATFKMVHFETACKNFVFPQNCIACLRSNSGIHPYHSTTDTDFAAVRVKKSKSVFFVVMNKFMFSCFFGHFFNFQEYSKLRFFCEKWYFKKVFYMFFQTICFFKLYVFRWSIDFDK